MCSSGGGSGSIGKTMGNMLKSQNRKGYFSYSIGGVEQKPGGGSSSILSGLNKQQPRDDGRKTLLGGR